MTGYVAETVRLSRVHLGLSRGQFAGLLGVDADTVDAWELGREWPTDYQMAVMWELKLASPDAAARAKEQLEVSSSNTAAVRALAILLADGWRHW